MPIPTISSFIKIISNFVTFIKVDASIKKSHGIDTPINIDNMKPILLPIGIMLAVMVSSCITIYESNGSDNYISDQSDKKIKLSGIIESESYTFDEIERYSATGIVPVVYHPDTNATKTTVKITADKAVLAHIKVAKRGNELRIYRNNNSHNDKDNLKITVTGPAMTCYKTEASATLSIAGTLSAPGKSLKLVTSSSSGIWADSISAGTISISSQSSSLVKVESVNAYIFKVTSSSSSEVNVDRIYADSTKADASSSSDVTLNGIAAKSVVATSSSSAKLILRGHTDNANIECSSSGTVSWKNLSVNSSFFHTY